MPQEERRIPWFGGWKLVHPHTKKETDEKRQSPFIDISGAGDGNRTRDFQLGNM